MKASENRTDFSGAVAIATRDYKLWRLPRLREFLGCPIAVGNRAGVKVKAYAGWGCKESGMRSARMAERRGAACWRLEDGFLRSVHLGDQDPPLSIVIDDTGMYYDAGRSSRLESLIPRELSPAETARARSLIGAWRAGRVSKYNHLREFGPLGDEGGVSLNPTNPLNAGYVLAADQTFGDASVRYGSASAKSFERMIEAALDENPGCAVIVKIHPDVFAGRKKGYLNSAALSRRDRVRVLAEDWHPAGLIEQAAAVYTATSQLGFEGLIWGKRVRVFGMPFYAGWGLTQDELAPPERRGRVSLEQLVHAALVDYPRYVNPESGLRCEVEAVLAHIALQRQMRGRFPPVVYAQGFSIYKKPIVRRFFAGSRVRFLKHAGRRMPEGSVLAVWGGGPRPHGVGEGGKLLRLEDGFLRSVGLGADLVRPLSWVMDGRGMYYDAAAPSDLEHLLQTRAFAPDLVARAKALRIRIVASGLTKYNVGGASWRRPAIPGLRVLLVPGQVESDASIRCGAPEIKTNIDLLRAVREANPDAHVIYKPHPDVVAGLRSKGAGEEDACRWCDELLADAAIHPLIEAVDEVHVLTSLAGFEALLREKKVVTYGQPFYAGWGLTQDMMPVARRTRRLALDELVAGALIEYPTYVSRTTGRFTTPERALDELLAWRETVAADLPLWRRGLRQVLRWRSR